MSDTFYEKELNEVISTVLILNEQFWDELYDEHNGWMMESDGYNHYIKFMGQFVWDSINDERSYNIDGTHQESILEYVKKKSSAIVDMVSKYKW